MARVLVISGSDSCGGAGMQADVAACVGMGCEVLSVITAVTAQHRGGVVGIEPVGLEMIEAQFRAALKDAEMGGGWGIGAVKVGMLGSKEVAELVGRLLREAIEQEGAGMKEEGEGSREGRGVLKNIVVDPVLAATSGGELGREGTAEAIVKHILPVAELITPNIDEAKIIAGMPKIDSIEDCNKVWRVFMEMGAKRLLLKGGHAGEWQGGGVGGEVGGICDMLYGAGDGGGSGDTQMKEYRAERIITEDQFTHGTGCTLSSAVAAGLAKGLSVEVAVGDAINFVRNRIQKHINY